MKNRSTKEIRTMLREIPGGVGTNEISVLYEIAKKAKYPIVEIGSWKGRSTICLALGSKDGYQVPIYAIDPHTGSPDQLRHGKSIWSFDDFINNISRSGVEDLVKPLLQTSDQALMNWQQKVSVVFIDADYDDYELTTHDILSWSKHLVDGGVVALHNTQPSFRSVLEHIPLFGRIGPKKFMIKNVYFSKKIFVEKTGGAISVLSFGKKTLVSHLRNFLYLVIYEMKYIFLFLYNLARHTPKPIKKIFRPLLPH